MKTLTPCERRPMIVRLPEEEAGILGAPEGTIRSDLAVLDEDDPITRARAVRSVGR